MYITINEAAMLLGISGQAIRNRIKKNPEIFIKEKKYVTPREVILVDMDKLIELVKK